MPATNSLPQAFEPLLQYLNDLSFRASVSELRQRLEALELTVDDMREFAIFDKARYRRNLVFECEMAEVLLICWSSGQRSPIHNHAGSTCGFKVMQGTGVETVFESTPSGQIMATGSTMMKPGYICASKDSDIHQVANLQAPGEDLITLHIYSPPLREMDQFSLSGGRVERYRPTNFEHADGSGI